MTVSSVERPFGIGKHHDRQRASRRTSCHVPALIVDDGVLLGECIITDSSDGGLRLFAPFGFSFPDRFEVEAKTFDNPVKVATVWRDDAVVGVRIAINTLQMMQYLCSKKAA